MRKVLLITAMLLSPSRPAMADWITLCTTPNGVWCVGPAPSGFIQLYVVHSLGSTIGTISSRFTVDITAAPGTTLLGFDSPFSYTGDVNGELSVNYGTCITHLVPTYVGTVYMVAACGELRIAPASAVNCSGKEEVAYTDVYGALCTCGTQTSRCYPVATESATWGAVKALYR